jgi:hypothetical protein
MVSLYTMPYPGMLQQSYNTLLVCKYQGDAALKVIDAQSVLSVVAMPPLPLTTTEVSCNVDGKYDNLFYVGNKPGLETMHYAGADKDMGGEEQNDDDGED